MNRTDFGTLKRASRPAHHSSSSFAGDAVRDDERDADLSPALVGHADNGHVGDARMLVEYRLDLGRIDVLAARDVHVLEPALDPVEALVVALGDVTGAQPAVLA